MPVIVATSWPPRSPHAALLSSPSGKRRAQEVCSGLSTSPSPSNYPAKGLSLARLQRPLRYGLEADKNEDKEEGEDEDEETLRLRLEAIEARLKIKMLQQKKKSASQRTGATEQDASINEGKGTDHPAGQGNTLKGSSTGPSALHEDVQVQASPRRDKARAEQQTSPGRILLGIDKGLKAKNVSLRNPRSPRKSTKAGFDPFTAQEHSAAKNAVTSNASIDSMERPKSFSERIAAIRKEDKDRKAKIVRKHKDRSTGFGLSDQDIEACRQEASRSEANGRSVYGGQTPQSLGFSRAQILSAADPSTSKCSQRSQQRLEPNWAPASCSHAGSEAPRKSKQRSVDARETVEPSAIDAGNLSSQSLGAKATIKESSAQLDRHSSIQLSHRSIPASLLDKTLKDKSILNVPSLLSSVKSPEYSLPDDLEVNFVVIGIIASKSSPFAHKNPKPNKSHNKDPDSTPKRTTQEAEDSFENENGKYQVFTLTDLKWSVDLYLFDTAFTRFRKLTPGTLIAVLNPSIMPPPPGKSDTGRFSLTLNSSEDTILEIGTARDLGWCKSVKKDGKRCSAWIDARHTSVCEYHVDSRLEKTRAGRMEVNTISTTYGPRGKGGGRTGFWGKSTGKGKKKEEQRWGAQYDWSTMSTCFVAPGIKGQSAARLLDNEANMERGGTAAQKADRARREREAKTKEKELARELGRRGNGAGGEYLKIASESTDRQSEGGERDGAGRGQPSKPYVNGGEAEDIQRQKDLEEAKLGLMGNKAVAVQLSPIKKRKLEWMIERDKERKRRRKEAHDTDTDQGEVTIKDDDDDLELV